MRYIPFRNYGRDYFININIYNIIKMKEINIKIVIDEETGKIATVKKVIGFNNNSISHQFEILGILDNLMSIQRDKIKILDKRTA